MKEITKAAKSYDDEVIRLKPSVAMVFASLLCTVYRGEMR